MDREFKIKQLKQDVEYYYENTMMRLRELAGGSQEEDVCGSPAITRGPMPASIDPWTHRNAGMRCQTCMWCVEKRTNEERQGGRPVGRCRRHAPTNNGYPAVYMNDWCGDHKIDENKA